MQRYLVTGGAGFIGSRIVHRLLREGHFVVVLDNFFSGKEENLLFINSSPEYVKRYRLIRGDIRDFSTCLRACDGIDFVLHQAALRSVPKSLENPVEYNEVNINGTLNLLKAAKQQAVKRFIFASSSSIYGDTDQFPEKETDLPRLISPYALTKLAGEYYCRIYSQIYKLSTVCLRYFNVYGPHQAIDDEYAVVIPKFISCLLRDEPPPIFGNGRQSRDFTYIDDVVQANLLACNTSGLKWAVLNIANGSNRTVLELVALLNKIMNKNIQPAFLPERPGDVFKTLADISQAEEIIGYQPGIDFQAGLERTVEWLKQNQGD